MEKIKLTKHELKKQRDNLKMFLHYLPVLQLKKQQLQVEKIKIQHHLTQIRKDIKDHQESTNAWVDVFAEKAPVKSLLEIKKVYISTGNIGGADVPILEKIEFLESPYDFLKLPLWVDYGLIAIKERITLNIKLQVAAKQLAAVREELRITTQRVNLFEKIKIVQAQASIRKIQIALGDSQTAAVIRGKIAKDKIQKKQLVLVES